MEVDLQKEARRGRAARAELALVREHLEEEKQKLFGQFCDPRCEEEVYVIREEAKALQKVEDFLESLVTTGELAEKTNEGDLV
jgi:DNA-binding TFAR19-related protein (PDSD5 family)